MTFVRRTPAVRRKAVRKTPIPTESKVRDSYVIAELTTPLFPAKTKRTGMLYYDSDFSITPLISGAAANYVFSANGCFDPDITGTGHQPMGFDQMMLMYNQYTVTAAAITISFVPTTHVRAALYLNPNATPLTNQAQLIENGLVKSLPFLSVQSGTGLQQPQLKQKCDIKKYFGRKTDRELLDDINLYGTASANPTEQVYFVFAAWQNSNLVTGTALYFDVLISYDVIFWEEKKLTQS